MTNNKPDDSNDNFKTTILTKRLPNIIIIGH